MKISFNLHERLVFLDLLPKENNFITLKVIRKAQKDLGLTDEEFSYYGVRIDEEKPGVIHFSQDKAEEEKEFEIGEIVFELVKSSLDKMNEQNKLPMEYFSLYEKMHK